jgi:hypothetical protein
MILGFFDATIGLKVSMLLDANIGTYRYEITPSFWILILSYMVAFGAFTGLIGGGLARILEKRGAKA